MPAAVRSRPAYPRAMPTKEPPSLTFPNESAEYRTARRALLDKERELRRQIEAVAALRRALPPGGAPPEDYVFDGAQGRVKLSELFGDRSTLAIYSYMSGPERELPCPMCTPLLQGLAAVDTHVAQRLSFVIASESPIARLLQWGRELGWKRIGLVSVAGTTYNRDYHGKGSTSGKDTTMLNVFRRDPSGAVHHFWGTEMAHDPGDPGQDSRGLDFLNPIFNMFDVTPEGRGDFYTKLRYDDGTGPFGR